MNYWAYFFWSTAVFAGIVGEALLLYPNYFSALVGLSDSAVRTVVIVNFACCVTVLWTKLVVFVFLDKLTSLEVQSVYNRGWLFLCNFLLFWGARHSRLNVNPYNLGVCMLSILVLLVLHWVCTTRVRHLEAADPRELSRREIFRIVRLGLLCFTLVGLDFALCKTAIDRFMEQDYTLAMFAFFFIDLLEMSLVFCGELGVNVASSVYLYKNEDEDEWEKSTLLIASVRLVGSLLAVVSHCGLIYALGIRSDDTWSIVVRSIRLYKHTSAFMKAITAQSDLDTVAVPATSEDITRESTCVICREEMDLVQSAHKRKAPKRLRCGHTMHAGCLASWLARSAQCPTCRQPVHSASSTFRDNVSAPAPDVQLAQGQPRPAPGPAAESPDEHAAHGEVRAAADSLLEPTRTQPPEAVADAQPRQDTVRHSVPALSPLHHESPAAGGSSLFPPSTRAASALHGRMSQSTDEHEYFMDSHEHLPDLAVAATSNSDTQLKSAQSFGGEDLDMVPIPAELWGANSGIIAGKYRFTLH